ncbi:MAG: Spx/MgsR family RNA polymerase-binding regulatory protein [candidate division SR1 bacterium]|nr:Spx/MgsR family RNA polymerase-binding regulatory protein [candidate division SR1 bacterium]
MIIVYGIVNCTTVQKACKWLESNNIEYIFHDYKKLGIDSRHLKSWCKVFGWEQILNRSGMMWRKASETTKQKVLDETSAIDFMIQVPNSIKRPLIEANGKLLRGFEIAEYEKIFL